MTTKYYEESEYYVKEYEGRESVKQEHRTRGTPFELSLRYERPPYGRESRLRDEFPDFQRLRDDFDSRGRPSNPTSGYASMDRRQQSLPPLYRTTYYDYPTHSSSRVPPGPTVTYPYSTIDSTTKEPYRTYSSDPYRSTTIHEPTYRSPTEVAPHHTYRPATTTPMEPPINTSRPGSPQPVAGPGDIQNTEEEDPAAEQTLKRSFSRKYAIPDDIRLESIKSYMSDNGFLIVKGNRKTWKETEINVHFDPINAPASNV